MKERPKDLSALFELEYSEKIFIVEVSYSKKDIAITEARHRKYEFVKERDNSRGFTENYRTYEDAVKRAERIARELQFSF